MRACLRHAVLPLAMPTRDKLDVTFLDGGRPFNGLTTRASAAGGMQHATASLAEAFARAGHRVAVCNGSLERTEIHGVHWTPLSECSRVEGDLVIANHNVWLFDRVSRGKKVVWFRIPANLYRLWKRGNLLPILRHRPHAVFLGGYHESTASRFLPFATRRIIEHGCSAEFTRSCPRTEPPSPRALFTSQPYRGLQWVLDIWVQRIHPAIPAAELHVFAPGQQTSLLNKYKHVGVRQRGLLARPELANELMNARVLLCPGHRDETYCNAAAEATAAGVPVVSRGIGSLAERVQHGTNGYIAREEADFAQHASMVLGDNARWLAMHHAMIRDRDLLTWDDCVRQWCEAFAQA
jgi:glycosyltransferase involved in cell wall biosynthesis